MIYDLRLSIETQTASAALNARNVLRIMPLERPGMQRRITGAIAVQPVPDERLDRLDFFGNPVTELGFHHPVAALSFQLTARVERWAEAPPLDLSPERGRLLREIRQCLDLGPLSPHHFLGAAPYTGAVAEIAAFARAAAGSGATALETVTTLGTALHAEMRFIAGATEVDTPAAEAFRARHGVCQDFSHIMIIGLRALGVPAGYVSGLLRTEPPPGQPRLEGADAMHAWVRAWCGQEMGWVEYDPTNAMPAGEDHVTVALGRDYADVAPVKGALRVSGAQTSQHAVDLIPVG